MVIDTHALHAFEFAAGVFIDAPRDSPFSSGAAQGLTLAAAAAVCAGGVPAPAAPGGPLL